jgi:hypothetical protein
MAERFYSIDVLKQFGFRVLSYNNDDGNFIMAYGPEVNKVYPLVYYHQADTRIFIFGIEQTYRKLDLYDLKNIIECINELMCVGEHL